MNHKKNFIAGIFFVLFVLLGGAAVHSNWIQHGLSYGTFRIIRAQQEFGFLHLDSNLQNLPLQVSNSVFQHGLGTHSYSEIDLVLQHSATTFSGLVGIDDSAAGRGEVVFFVMSGTKLLWRSEVIKGAEKAVPFEVNVQGINRLRLIVDKGPSGSGNSDHADWLELKLN